MDSKEPEPIFTKQPPMSNTPKFKGNKLKRLEKNPDDEDPVEKHRLYNHMVLNCDHNVSDSTTNTFQT